MRVRLLTYLTAVVALVSGFVKATDRVPPQIPVTFTNLQVLPKDISRQNLVNAMKAFCASLDVRCEHCHVGEGDDLSKFDFASDAKTTKKTARAMLRMVDAINKQHLSAIASPTGAPTITCYTCHRGTTKPLTAPAGGGGISGLQ